MNTQQHSICAEAIRQVSNSYARQWKSIDIADLVQEGWTIALRALHGQAIDDRGIGGYVRTALVRSLHRYCVSQASVVGGYAREKNPKVCSIVSGGTDSPGIDGEPELASLAYEAGELIANMRIALSSRIRELYESITKKAIDQYIDAGMSVLMDGIKPQVAAATAKMDRVVLYRILARMVTCVRDDQYSTTLLKGIKQVRADKESYGEQVYN